MKKLHVCPPWLCFTFDNRLREMIHNPDIILGKYVKQGFTVLDIGPGKGFFTSKLTDLVGDTGKVIAIDIQEKMLDAVQSRVRKYGRIERLQTRLCTNDSPQISERYNFANVFWMYHEVSNKLQFVRELYEKLDSEGCVLISEPGIHVRRKKFDKSIDIALSVGFYLSEEPKIALSHSAILRRHK